MKELLNRFENKAPSEVGEAAYRWLLNQGCPAEGIAVDSVDE